MVDESGDDLVGLLAGPQRHLQGVEGQLVGIAAAVRHPTMRREYTSLTNALNAIWDQVAT